MPRFDNRWGPASVIAALAFFFSFVNFYFSSNSDVNARVTRIEAQSTYTDKRLERIENKIDQLLSRP